MTFNFYINDINYLFKHSYQVFMKKEYDNTSSVKFSNL